MDISQRDKVMLLVGASIGVIVIGIALEGVQTYAASREARVWIEFLRGSADGSQTDVTTERSSGGPTAVPTAPMAGNASVKPDILEPAYTNDGVPEEFRVSE